MSQKKTEEKAQKKFCIIDLMIRYGRIYNLKKKLSLFYLQLCICRDSAKPYVIARM